MNVVYIVQVLFFSFSFFLVTTMNIVYIIQCCAFLNFGVQY